jgi:hypothetical protein
MKTYIIRLNNSKLIKIGRTTDIDSRIRNIKTANPFVNEVVYYEGDIERYLHRCLSMFRVRGEWFDIDLNEEDFKLVFNNLIETLKNSKDECDAVSKVILALR